MFHSQNDWLVIPTAPAGWFDRIPASTPKRLVHGRWLHQYPDDSPTVPLEAFEQLVHAWMDRYLLDADTGVESLPSVAVQDNLGAWNAYRGWPEIDARAGHLVLSAGGVLGTETPAGETRFSEVSATAAAPTAVAANSVSFTSAPFAARTRITGQPVADLWLSADASAAVIAARLEIIDAAGTVIDHPAIVGARSVRHRAAMPNDYFEQEEADGYAVGSTVRLPIRLNTVDVVIPEMHRLRLTLSGVSVHDFPERIVTQPSGSAATVTVQHSCARMSALRFDVPIDRSEPKAREHRRSVSTAGTPDPFAPVCGRAPEHPLAVTRSVRAH